MARTISVEEAVKRAELAQQSRTQAIRTMAESHTDLVNARQRAEDELSALKAAHARDISALERQAAASYASARSAGWSPTELAKIGFTEPTTTVKRRRPAAANEGNPSSHE